MNAMPRGNVSVHDRRSHAPVDPYALCLKPNIQDQVLRPPKAKMQKVHVRDHSLLDLMAKYDCPTVQAGYCGEPRHLSRHSRVSGPYLVEQEQEQKQ